MGIWIQISTGSSQPIYAQIVAQVESAVARRELQPGDKLPPVRRLAEELVVNPNTVAKAYSLMEQAGLVSTRQGAGTFVADPALRAPGAHDLHHLTERIDTLISRAISLGLSAEALRDLFGDRLTRFEDTREGMEEK